MSSSLNKTVPQQSYSQFGEDLLVLRYFSGKSDGFFIEVGANDPENLSQTLLLELHGWRGILVEPQSSCCERIRQLRPKAQLFQAACGAPEQRGKARLKLNSSLSKLTSIDPAATPTGSEEVQIMTLDEILQQAGNPRIDFVSLDVEGFELQVLRGFDLGKHEPRLILIEDNFPNRLKVHAHMKQHGYRLVKRTGCNNWYVPKDAPFDLSTTWEKLKLFRKMFIGTAFRQLKSRVMGNQTH
jgi:FkbM family methyltransferase